MGLSRCRNSGLSRSRVYLRSLVVSLGVLAWFGAGSTLPSNAYTPGPPSPALICGTQAEADLAVLEVGLSPANGATVQAGTSVALSGDSRSPLTFDLASSLSLLSTVPDLGSGLGTAQAEPISVGPPGVNSYVFTSTLPAGTASTLYWDTYFSTASLASCEGLAPVNYTTVPRSLAVVAPPASPTPVTPVTPPAFVVPPPLRVGIGAPDRFRITHPAVRYAIDCTASCSGDTSYEAFVTPRRAKTVHVSKLDLTPKQISLATATGGDVQVVHAYSGAALRLLKGIIRAGGEVKLHISVTVTDSAGHAASARRTARLG
jgi:hypothetical protein